MFSASLAFHGVGVGAQPLNNRLKFLHQMWFMPVTFRIRLAGGGLAYGKSNSLNGDETWVPFLSWQRIFKPGYKIYYLLANFRRGALVSLILIGSLSLVV